MKTHHITRFVARFFKFILTLLTLLIAQFLLTAILIQMLKRSKKFRAKFFKLVNPPTLYLAGRRFSPFVLLTYTGRRSGRAYQTPLRAYAFGDGLALGMTYGPEVEWCRNVMAAGKAICKWQGQEYILERPEIIPARLALSTYPLPIQLATRMGIVKHCLWLHKPAEGSIK